MRNAALLLKLYIQDVTNTRSICRKVRIQQRAIFMGTCAWMGKGKGMGREYGYGTLSTAAPSSSLDEAP